MRQFDDMIWFALFAIVIVGAVGRMYRPLPTGTTGTLLWRSRLPLLARLRFHAVPVVILLGGAALVWGLGDLSLIGAGMVLGAVVILLEIPVRYTYTTDGIRFGRTPMRRWTEFAGVARRPGGARLQGIAGGGGSTVWLAGTGSADEAILAMRQLVRGSYQGHLIEVESTADGSQPFAPLYETRLSLTS